MAVGRLVGWLVGVVVCAPLVLCAGNQGVSRLYKRHGPAKYRASFTWLALPSLSLLSSRGLPHRVACLSPSASISLFERFSFFARKTCSSSFYSSLPFSSPSTIPPVFNSDGSSFACSLSLSLFTSVSLSRFDQVFRAVGWLVS